MTLVTPKRLLARLRCRLSQRGALLLIVGVVDLVYAFGLRSAPQETRVSATYAFYAALLPLWAWSALWACVGALCLTQAWTPRDRVAYTAAAGLLMLWAGLHVAAWIAGVLPRGYVLGVIWLLAATVVMIMSTVPRPDRGAE